MYIYENEDWPKFTWNETKINALLTEVSRLQGQIIGRLIGIGILRDDATLEILSQDVIKTSEIEGEKLDANQVRSSIAKRLGIPTPNIKIDRNIEGVVEMLLNATQQYNEPVNKDRLCLWHKMLFPNELYSKSGITIGNWRKDTLGPMQVISGGYGREKVHFEAPSHDKLSKEMKVFLKWIEAESKLNLILKAGIAHFWFVTIHPFDDGNGRIARAITDLVLARSENSSSRCYSMSAQIQAKRKDYYQILENTQRGTLDITLWLEWFLNCLKRSILASNNILNHVLLKARFWEKHQQLSLNDRQKKVILQLLEDFEGVLTTQKWAKLTKCSPDTALRDINDLIAKNVLSKNASGGRTTNYILNI